MCESESERGRDGNACERQRGRGGGTHTHTEGDEQRIIGGTNIHARTKTLGDQGHEKSDKSENRMHACKYLSSTHGYISFRPHPGCATLQLPSNDVLSSNVLIGR